MDMERITSRKNPKLAHLKKLGASREYRYACGEFLCAGEKLLREAMQFGGGITAVLTASGDAPEGLDPSVPVYGAGEELLDYASPLKSPPELLFSCRMRGRTEGAIGSAVVLDGVQDPGNVGTVLRTANAMDVDAVLLLPGCADPYNPKTVRATMGAVFRQRFFETDLDGLRALKAGGLRLLGAALGEGCRPIGETDLRGAAVAIGSEGRGLSKEVISLCDGLVRIPMSPRCESLNAAVAAAIIMWEMCGKCLR